MAKPVVNSKKRASAERRSRSEQRVAMPRGRKGNWRVEYEVPKTRYIANFDGFTERQVRQLMKRDHWYAKVIKVEAA